MTYAVTLVMPTSLLPGLSKTNKPLSRCAANCARTFLGANHYDAKNIKPAIHLCSIPFHLSQDWFFGFFSTHSSRKIRHVIHSKLQSCTTTRSTNPYSSPNRRISDFLASSRGLNLGRPFDLAATLARGSKLASAQEMMDFEFVGIPSI
ncbi:hypothetical protein AVEN_125627-1 [Araneus ventricosus]|uniref:Uncharacterized protein n=1 Tax=Araneus ventricosus TaxID=182803 RepID=A0A4Y2J1X1_ARAVE|nr:hypothetical protein AVEN_125627-1 [Araneus ventricosus]